MAKAVSYYWDFDDGETSTSPSPTHIYLPGVYSPSVSIVDDTGARFTTRSEDLIVVTEEKVTLFSPSYIDRSKSFHFGTNPAIASGWSRNTGDNWVWPEAQAAVSHQIINGIDHLLVWDMYDDIQYCINPRNTSTKTITHQDKEEYNINCSATFGAMVGESRTFDIMHQETVFHLRKDIDTGTRPIGMSTFVSVLDDDGVEIEKIKLVTGTEVVFKEQSSQSHGEHKQIQLKFETDKSGYLISGYDSICKTDDKMRIPNVDLSESPDLLFSDMAHYLSCYENYSIDAATGDEVLLPETHEIISGLNGYPTLKLNNQFGVDNYLVETGSLIYWYKTSDGKPTITGTFDNSVTELETVDIYTYSGYTLTYYVGEVFESLTFDSGTIFDFRILNNQITEADALYYASRIDSFVGGY